MYFSELQNLEKANGKIKIEILNNLFPNTPKDVIKGVYSDFGNDVDFIYQYGKIDLDTVCWTLCEFTGKEIFKASVYKCFEGRVYQCSLSADDFERKGFKCLSVRNDNKDEYWIRHWQDYNTWYDIPFAMDGRLINKTGIHWVEGHTRLGTLKGLISKGIIPKDKKHKVWFCHSQNDNY